MSDRFQVPSLRVESQYEVKKSRFIARAAPANSRAAALAELERAKKDYPDARHHCWAYHIGSPHSPTGVAMSDDGEPTGTAGKPILNVLQHKLVGDIVLVVIRYFGGIKLGAGGLVRAYSQAAQQVMEELPLHQQVLLMKLTLIGDYALEQALRHWLSGHEGVIEEVVYSAEVHCSVSLPREQLSALKSFAGRAGARLDTRT